MQAAIEAPARAFVGGVDFTAPKGDRHDSTDHR